MPDNSYQHRKKRGGALVNVWFSEEQTKAIDDYVKSVSNSATKSLGVRVAVSRAQVIRAATLKLIGMEKEV